jgi:hypothetical protein
MIYKISAAQMPIVFERGGQLIVIGGDGVHGLIKNLSDTTDITIIEQYNDTELETLLTDPEWTQPCNNC